MSRLAAVARPSRKPKEEKGDKKTTGGAAYWRATLGLLTTVLVIWAVVSYGFGIILRPVLDNIHLGGYPLGFWFAQQGSIYIFVALIFWYAARMNKLDQEHDVHED